MVMRPTIQLKRVKDLEVGDRIRYYSILIEVRDKVNGEVRFWETVEQSRRRSLIKLGEKSQQFVELVENSKKIF